MKDEGQRGQKDDVKVVREVLAGDTDKFRLLVEKYERKVYNLVVRITRDPEQGRDLAQEAFIKAFKGLPKYKEEFPFRSWLFKIAQNNALEWLRRKSRRKEVPDGGLGEDSVLARTAKEAGFESPERKIDRQFMLSLLDEVIATLNPSFRSTLVLRHQEEMSQSEIAQALDIPIGTVKSRLNYAYRQLRALLRAKGADSL